MEPPEPSLLAGGLPAVIAAVLAIARSAIGSIAHARQAALLETLSGARRSALARYMATEQTIQARWLTLQACGLLGATWWYVSAGLTAHWAILVPLGTYVILSQLASVVVRVSAERVAPTMLAALRPLDVLAIPLADPFVLVSKAIARTIAPRQPSPSLTETEMEIMVTEGEQSGALDHDQSEMIRNVLEFRDTVAGELMVPRKQVVAVDVEIAPADLLRIIAEHEHSRYPVYRDRLDNVIGVLHVKDVFRFSTSNALEGLDICGLLRKPVFIPDTQLAASVLQQLRVGRHHMAIVIDEFGGMSGILTMEDLLEEIVGEIHDEHDTEACPIVELSNGNFVVDASVPIAELNRQVGIELPDGGDYNSLGGFIVEVMGRVPEPGAVFERLGHRFKIKTADERHIAQVEIERASLRASA